MPSEVTTDGKDPKACMPIYLKIDQARTAHASQQNEQARALLEEALAADPGNPAATRLLGNVLLYLGRPSEAVAAFDALLARAPGDTEAHLNRVRALIAGGRLDEAEQALSALRQVVPADRDARELYFQVLAHHGKLDLARRLLREATQAAPQDAGLLVIWARIEWGEKQYGEAEKLARRALEIDPTAAGAQAVLGEAQWRAWEAQGSPDDGHGGAPLLASARTSMEKALANDPMEPMAAFRLAWLERQAGNLENSIELYERVISAQPSMAQAHVNLANLLRERGATQMAIQHYEIARALGLATPQFLNNYGIALAASGRRDDAQRVWEEALAQRPDARMADGIRRNLERLRAATGRP